jgi:hypothetical protein
MTLSRLLIFVVFMDPRQANKDVMPFLFLLMYLWILTKSIKILKHMLFVQSFIVFLLC